MHRFFIILLSVLCFVSPAFSQKKELKVKFGKLSEKEIAMTNYEQDPAAAGVVLFDIGTVTNDYNSAQGFVMVFERHLRFKVFKKDALELADISIMHHKDNKVSDVKAISFNMENGQMTETKLGKENIFTEEITKYRRLTRFVVPAVKEGSIVDIKYSLSSGGGIDVPGWVFQREHIPTIWSEYRADVPTFIEFKKMSQGWVPFSLAEESTKSATLGGNITYMVKNVHYIQENVPALKTEEFVYSPKDYLSSISFDVLTVYEIDIIDSGPTSSIVNGIAKPYPNTWKALGKDIMEDVYEKDLKAIRFTAGIATSSTDGKTSIADKVAAVYSHIGNNFQLTKGYDRIFMSQNLETLVNEQKGTATDLNILFINMLRQQNVEAFPVLISTTDHGRLYSFRVSLDYVNRVVSAVQMEDSTLLLVDASAYPNPIGLLDKEDLGKQGILLRSKDDVEWINIQNKVADKSVIIANFMLNDEGKATGTVVCYESGYGGVESRKHIKSKGENQAIQAHFKDWMTDGEISELKLTNHDKWNESSVKMEFKLATSAFCNVAGDKIYLSPLLGLGLHENPFKNPERKFNIDLGPEKEAQYNLSFTIPNGYKVEALPKPAKVSFDENVLIFDYVTENTGSVLKFNVRVKQKTDSILVDGYPDLQQFYSTLASKMEEQVVLTKI